MPMAIPFIATAFASIGTAVASAGAALAFSGGLMAGLQAWATVASFASLGAALLMKPPGLASQGQQVNIKPAGAMAALPIAIGRTGVQGLIITNKTYGGSKNDICLIESVLSVGPINRVLSFSVMDRALGYSGNPNTGMATITSVSGVDMRASKLFRYDGFRFAHRLGSHTDKSTLSQITGDAVPGVSSQHSTPGLAKTILRLKLDEKQLSFPQGVPENPVTVLEGILAWNPRLDSTYPGGSGPQRRDNPATHAWSENPAIIGLNYVLGYYSPVGRMFGLGAAIETVDVAAFVNAANVADANGWKVGGLVSTADADWDVLVNILAAGGAVPLNKAGRLGVFVRTPKTAVLTIRQTDLNGAVKATTTAPMRSRINSITPSYVDPGNRYEIVEGQKVSHANWVAEDRGVERSSRTTYQLVQQAAQAHQLATYEMMDSREPFQFMIQTKPMGLGCEVGDLVRFDCAEVGADMMPCLVLDRKWDATQKIVSLTLKSENPDKHTFALGQSQSPPPPLTLRTFDATNPDAPETGSWEITATEVVGSQTVEGVELPNTRIPALVVSGDVTDPNVARVVVEIRPTPLDQAAIFPNGTTGLTPEQIEDRIADFGWQAGTEGSQTAQEFVISPLNPQTEYEVGVHYVTNLGAHSRRLVLAGRTGDNVVGHWPTDSGVLNPPITGIPPVLVDLAGGKIKAQFVALEGDVTKTVQQAIDEANATAALVKGRIDDAWTVLGENETTGLRYKVAQLEVAGPDGNLVQRIEGLESREEDALARLLNVETTQTTLTDGLATKAESSALNSLSATVNNPTSGLSATNTRLNTAETEIGKRALTTTVTALSSEINTERGRVNGALTRIGTVETTVANAATISSVQTLSGAINTEKGRIDAANTRIDAVKITADGAATTSSVQQLTQTVNGHTTSISSTLSIANEANNRSKATIGLTSNVNGYVSGFINNNNGVTSDFNVLANKFNLVTPGNPGDRIGLTGTQGLTLYKSGVKRVHIGFA